MRGHAHVLQMIIGTGRATAGTKTGHATTRESMVEIGTGIVLRGATVVVVGAEGDGGLEGLQVMRTHLEIGRWRKEWDFDQTLTFMTTASLNLEKHVFVLVNHSVFGAVLNQIEKNCIDS